MPHLIPFTQYLRPHGKQRTVAFPTDDGALWTKAKAILDQNLRFECEVLANDTVSFTISNGTDDLAIELAPNGPEAAEAVHKLISNFQGINTLSQVGEPAQTPTKQPNPKNQ